MKKAILLHQRENICANIRWVPPLSLVEFNHLSLSINELRTLGYWASPFPEGDGVTFSHERYDRDTAVNDISLCFSWLEINEEDHEQSVAKALQQLNENEKITIRYLVPADKLLIYESISLGPYTIHRPVVPLEHSTDKHPWVGELLDVPSADVDPYWEPSEAPKNSLARLLGYPLIEGSIQVEAHLLFPVGSGTAEWEPLALQVTEHADRALDVLRHRFCNYETPHFTPHHAGLIGNAEFRIAYLMPDRKDIKPHLIHAKPQVFEAVNVWLGLELDNHISQDDQRLSEIASGIVTNEIEERLRGSLRAKGQSFLLVSDEMRFVSMIFSADSVSFVGEKKGDDHRRHVAATAAGDNRELYFQFLDDMRAIYPFRNKIVHKGASFREMGVSAKDILIKMDRILSLCIDEALICGLSSESEFLNVANQRIKCFSIGL